MNETSNNWNSVHSKHIKYHKSSERIPPYHVYWRHNWYTWWYKTYSWM